jgi:hypothetical protein
VCAFSGFFLFVTCGLCFFEIRNSKIDGIGFSEFRKEYRFSEGCIVVRQFFFFPSVRVRCDWRCHQSCMTPAARRCWVEGHTGGGVN